jgi:hypothetical protein
LLIIIEGVDCTGKSTLADELAFNAMGEVIHRSKPARHPLEEYVIDIARYSPVDWNRTIIGDRWHVGETVWPTIFGRRTDFDLAMFTYVEAFLRSRGALMVHATGELHAIAARLEERGDDLLDPSDLGRAWEMFHERFRRMNTLPVVTHSIEDPLVVRHAVDRAAALASTASCGLRVTDHIVGNTFDPQILLVGDEVNTPGEPLPFVPYPSTSGHYLFELALDWPRVAITNAYRDGAPAPLDVLWRALNRPAVVALGRRSASVLEDLEVPAGVVPHPQYVRRFHHGRAAAYEDYIRLAAETRKDLVDLFTKGGGYAEVRVYGARPAPAV